MSARLFNEAEKDFIVADIHSRMFASGSLSLEGACLYWARMTGVYLHARYDVDTRLRAGSMCWPCVAPSEDDGKSPTHYSYVWDPDDPLSQAALAAGIMPELHAWIEIPDTHEIIDLTTRYLMSRATRAGLKWSASPPPPYLWTTRDKLPEGVIYRADPVATRFVVYLLALTF
jgi:hypothetical protein